MNTGVGCRFLLHIRVREESKQIGKFSLFYILVKNFSASWGGGWVGVEGRACCRNCQSLPQAELFVRQRERPGLHSQAVARPLEKETATHSSIHAWKIPWTEEPCGYTTSLELAIYNLHEDVPAT